MIEIYDEWITYLNNDVRKVVEILLDHFEYYTHEEVNEHLKNYVI